MSMTGEEDLITGGTPAGSRVVAVSVDLLADAPDGPRRMTIDLAAMVRHCRRERVEDLLEDLTLLCEDVQARRQPDDSYRPLLTVMRGNR